MLDYPQILSELIFERMPMDSLTLLAPFVLESDDRSFDDLTRTLFCRNFLNYHYERDTILDLVGKEFEAEKKGKPDRLSEIMKIIQKREDLKNNKKKLIPKATMELFTEHEFFGSSVKFSGSYIFTKDRAGDRIFKINRENDERSPIIEPIEYDPQNFIEYYDFEPEDSITMLETVFLGHRHEDLPAFFDYETLKFAELGRKRHFLHEKITYSPINRNFSRQRSWRDYKTNPCMNLHPVLNFKDTFYQEDTPMRRYVVDFSSFSGGQEKIFWSFDFSLPREDFCIPEYRDLSESLEPDHCDVGYVEGNKLHLLV
ncbi:Oidioi.mRNA.OKI2018_I69.chr2.g8401.t1.cds [Oikopleura dioica]|uniref:Oidioi.mRNA.OKI2018_I69.chr2.g8401.t1.cds n=1 Tax=Oikopleura dioica TaxID=34765 RepID=A0ABN7TDJ5_OIKDI|nr:Oidioi.mRNA.OKI2018_I69.chr2.g8401.t1.cds [Oikopleura dioica]